jgi:hypothetical protein
MRRILSCLLVFAVITGCSGDGPSDEEQITAVARTYVESLYNGEAKDFYDNLDSRTQELCGRDRIGELVALFHTTPRRVGPIAFDRVEEIEISGSTATAKIFETVNGSHKYYESTVDHFVKEKGKWRYASWGRESDC